MPESLKNRLILFPKATEITRHLDYLGLKYYSNPHDTSNQLARINFQPWEYRSREIFFELSKTMDLVLDVGAHSGIYSLIAARGSSSSKIFAFEPNPIMSAVLEKNIEINEFSTRITLHEFALSDSDGLGTLAVGDDTSMAMLRSKSSTNSTPTDHEVPVKIAKLDDFGFTSSSMLIKVDIEGSEIAFLNGAVQTIQLCKPTILMEALTDIELELQSEFLGKLGYDFPVCLGLDTGDERNYLWTPDK
jgi:FkbM family methyltransferase